MIVTNENVTIVNTEVMSYPMYIAKTLEKTLIC